MLENILKEFRRRFNHLKGLIISNAITKENAKIELSKFVFALGTIKTSLKKNETAFSAAQILKVNELLLDIADLKNIIPEIFEDIEENNILVEALKEHLPERIHTDSLEENTPAI